MRLLIVGAMEGHVAQAGKIAQNRGAKVAYADTAERGLTALRNGVGADMVLMDCRLDIAGFIRQILEERISVPLVAYGLGNETSLAVAAIKAGAKEYLPLPPDAELIAAVLEAVAGEQNQFIAKDPSMLAVLKMADQVARSDATVLITGESGTGKEVMARYIHAKSKRAAGHFVAVNCAAIPETLIESELFGHEKGAFTGAVARRLGKFEEANGGTLFLDEISEMSLPPQAKLLRAIQEKEITRLGGNGNVKIDLRLVATSNRNLLEYVQAKQFREDLYYRLNVINLHLPPLRTRKIDIPLLAEFFVKKYSEVNGVPLKSFSVKAMQKMQTYAWPGNVRELENTIHRSVLISMNDLIEPEAIILNSATDISANVQIDHVSTIDEDILQPGLVGQSLANVERQVILRTMEHCLGDSNSAAQILGITLRTLRSKLKAYEAAT